MSIIAIPVYTPRKRYKFFYHYNKPASRTAKAPRVTVHYRGKCHLVHNFVCMEDTHGEIRKRQPYLVVAGTTDNFTVVDNIAYIGPSGRNLP